MCVLLTTLIVLVACVPVALAQLQPPLPDTLVWERLPGPRTEDSLYAAASVYAEGDTLYACYWQRGTAVRRTIAGPDAADPSDFDAWETMFQESGCNAHMSRPTGSAVFFRADRSLEGLFRAESFDDPSPVAVSFEAESLPIATASGALVLRHEEGIGTGIGRSTDDGRTWQALGYVPGSEASVPVDLAYIPPSSDLPMGRIVGAGFGGIAYSDDDGLTWQASNVFGDFTAIFSDVIRIEQGPHAGRLLAAGDTFDPNTPVQSILASDDGATWTLIGGLTGPGQRPKLYHGPGGVVLGVPEGPNVPIEASADGGETWHQLGYIAIPMTDYEHEAYYVWDLALGGDGHLYAAVYWRNLRDSPLEGHEGGVYRTTARLPVATEPRPAQSETGSLGVRAFPNPSSGAVTVALAGHAAGEPVRVVVYDALGREVATLHDGPVAAPSLRLDVPKLSPGLYLVRATSETAAVTSRLSVVR